MRNILQQHKFTISFYRLVSIAVPVAFFLTSLLSFNATAEVYLPAKQIEALITETHKIKRNGSDQLRENLTILEEHKLILNQAQLEEFMYLNAYHASMQGDTTNSIKLHQRLDHSNNINNRIRSFRSQLNMHLFENNFRASEILIDKLLMEVELLEQNKDKFDVFETIGYYYNHIEEYQLGLNYFSLIDKSALNDEALCLLGFHESISKLGLGIYKPNNPLIINHITFCKNINQLVVGNSLVLENARALTNDNQFIESLELLNTHQDDLNLSTYKLHQFDYHSQLMKNHLELKQFEQANQFASMVIEEIPSNQKSKWVLKSLRILAQLAERQNNYSEALTHLQSYQNALKEDFDIKKRKAMARAQVSHQVNEHNRRLDSLREINKKNRNTVDQLTQENNDLLDILYLDKIIIACLFILVCILYLLVFGLRARKQGVMNLCHIDQLTKAFTHRYYIDLLASKIYKAKFANQHLTLITINFDNFKRINSDYGYAHGDYILAQTSKIFSELSPDDANLSRVGGDEFSVIRSNCISDNAMIFCERFREKVKQITSEDGQTQYHITASFGIADTRTSKYIPKSLLSDSNKALLKAKNKGKNAIVTFDTSMSMRRKKPSMSKLKYVYKS